MKNGVLLFGIVACCIAFSSRAQTLPYGKVIAHRGAWKHTGTPQNSIASLQEAIRLECYGSEFDVWLTGDSIPVLNHDADFYGMPVEKRRYNELLSKRHPNGEPLPTLRAFLGSAKNQRSTRLILEIKNSDISPERTLELTRRCVAIVRDLDLEHLVDYISFSYPVCLLVRQLSPSAEIAYLSGDKSPEELNADGINGLDYHFQVYRQKEEWIREARNNQQSLNVWTVNDSLQMNWFLDKQFDYITTDEPELLLRLRKTHPGNK